MNIKKMGQFKNYTTDRHLLTSRMLKLCLRSVDKCKRLAVRSCNIEVCFCLVDILNSKIQRKVSSTDKTEKPFMYK